MQYNKGNAVLALMIAGALVCLLGFLYFIYSPEPVPQVPQEPQPGAQVGPDNPSNYYSDGGVQKFDYLFSCKTATSTMFSLKNPFNATSTLVFAAVSGTNGATTTDFLVGTSTSANPAGTAVSTSTLKYNVFGLQGITAGAKFDAVAGVMSAFTPPSSTPYPTSQENIIVKPNEYVLGFATSTTPAGNGGIASHSLSIPASCKGILRFVRNNY